MRRLENHSTPPARQWTLALAVMVVLGATSCAREAPGPEHLHYRISAALDPPGQSIEASVDLTFRSPAPALRTASFLLHRQLQVTAVTGPAISDYRFDTTVESSIPWIPAAGLLHVSFAKPLGRGEHTTIHVEYGGIIDTWEPWSANVLTEEWTELGLYFPWFPYNETEYGPFTFEVDVAIDPAYELRGFGVAERTDTGWHLQQDRAVNDIVLVASRDLRTRGVEADGYAVHVHFTSLEDSVAVRVAGEAVSALRTYAEWFGGSAATELTLVESQRELGGGYARPGLIVLSRLSELATPEHHAGLLRYLAHEAAHFWWTLAPAATWEDWLNESFAEYSALLVLRDLLGEAEFQDRLAQKRRAAQGTPPIWGFERGDTSTDEKAAEVETILYSAGPVLLDQLATRISPDRFLAWCRELVRQEVRSTERALGVLRVLAGEESANWFQERLQGAAR